MQNNDIKEMMSAREFAVCRDIANFLGEKMDKKFKIFLQNNKLFRESIPAYFALITAFCIQDFISSLSSAFHEYEEMKTFKNALFNEINFHMNNFVEINSPELDSDKIILQ